jgi:deoxyhypusine monooxygenase
MGGEDVVPHVANILKNDVNELVRHEAAFSLGQMCLRSGIKPLEDATRNDPSLFVRHEAAVALGVIGSQDAKETLQKALEDSSEQVRDSAVVALSNLKFMEHLCKNEKFAKLTGG